MLGDHNKVRHLELSANVRLETGRHTRSVSVHAASVAAAPLSPGVFSLSDVTEGRCCTWKVLVDIGVARGEQGEYEGLTGYVCSEY